MQNNNQEKPHSIYAQNRGAMARKRIKGSYSEFFSPASDHIMRVTDAWIKDDKLTLIGDFRRHDSSTMVYSESMDLIYDLSGKDPDPRKVFQFIQESAGGADFKAENLIGMEFQTFYPQFSHDPFHPMFIQLVEVHES